MLYNVEENKLTSVGPDELSDRRSSIVNQFVGDGVHCLPFNRKQ